MVPKVHDPPAHPARQAQKVVDGSARVDLALGQLGDLVPEKDPPLHVQLP